MLPAEAFLEGKVVLHCGDSREAIKSLAENSIDALVCDPPYALTAASRNGSPRNNDPETPFGRTKLGERGFMGKTWDTGETAFDPTFWAECLRVLKPGGHVVAFSGTRTYHRMACAIEDAGFEIRDMLSWLYGSGFPKSLDVAKALDKRGGHHRGQRGVPIPFQSVAKGAEYERTPKGAPVLDEAKQWDGWGTALKPACEPICFGRKPLIGTVAQNVLQHGTGAINVDGCRIHSDDAKGYEYTVARTMPGAGQNATGERKQEGVTFSGTTKDGRWPANIIHDGSEEVIAAFPELHGAGSQRDEPGGGTYDGSTGIGFEMGAGLKGFRIGDSGSASRFFYAAKADTDDRLGSKHPTVKPVDLMQWLCRLVTPPGGIILDPFAGTGTTGEAAFREGFSAVLIEREAEYQADIRRRMGLVLSGPDERSRESIKARTAGQPIDHGPLFADPDTPPRDSANIRDTRASSTSALRPNHRTDGIEMVKP